MSSAAQDELSARIRAALAGQPSIREARMFGGLAFMVNGKIALSAGRTGDLLVRVPTDRHEQLLARPGAAQAVMGTNRVMGAGWITVSAGSIAADARLGFWLDAALSRHRT